MPKLPMVTAKTIIQFLNHLGFEFIRQKVSQKFFKHPDSRTATVPDHPGEDLGRGILRKILNDVKVPREDFINWLSR